MFNYQLSNKHIFIQNFPIPIDFSKKIYYYICVETHIRIKTYALEKNIEI